MSYMGSGLAQTHDPKSAKKGLGSGLMNTTSAASLKSAYQVPSQDGRLIPAVPVHLALKYKPPTIAVVYTMKDPKSGRNKKYIHEIKIRFEPNESLEALCDDMIDKNIAYLNPQFIARQQVSHSALTLLDF